MISSPSFLDICINYILKHLNNPKVHSFLIILLKELAKNTDNDIDDLIVEIIEKKLNKIE
jgi:hypothetical protein